MPSIFLPILSPEHGAYIVLLASFFVGAISAGEWNLATSVALVSVFAAFQAQFPVMRMLRRGASRRLLFWAAVYGAITAATTLWLIALAPALVRIVWVAIAVFGVAVLFGALRKYKSLGQELVVFAGLTLAAPWAETATYRFMPYHAVGLWILLTIAFWGAVFAVRIRSRGSAAIAGSLIVAFVGIALAVILAVIGMLSWRSLWLLAPSYVRLAGVVAKPTWWRSLTIRWVGVIESCVAVCMVALAAVVL